MSYKNLEIWNLSKETSIGVHQMTLHDLPKFEMYETGSQIHRSSKSIRSNIVEGYGRRRYKGDFIRFLTYSFASYLETYDHLEQLYETKSLTNEARYNQLMAKLEELGRKLNKFIQSVESYHNKTYSNQLKEPQENYETDFDQMISNIQNQKSNII